MLTTAEVLNFYSRHGYRSYTRDEAEAWIDSHFPPVRRAALKAVLDKGCKELQGAGEDAYAAYVPVWNLIYGGNCFRDAAFLEMVSEEIEALARADRATVVDVGCGGGLELALLASHYPNLDIYGLDQLAS